MSSFSVYEYVPQINLGYTLSNKHVTQVKKQLVLYAGTILNLPHSLWLPPTSASSNFQSDLFEIFSHIHIIESELKLSQLMFLFPRQLQAPYLPQGQFPFFFPVTNGFFLIFFLAENKREKSKFWNLFQQWQGWFQTVAPGQSSK